MPLKNATIHHVGTYGNFYTDCGRPYDENKFASTKWKEVNCPQCIKLSKPKTDKNG